MKKRVKKKKKKRKKKKRKKKKRKKKKAKEKIVEKIEHVFPEDHEGFWEAVDPGVEHKDFVAHEISVGNQHNVWAINRATKDIFQLQPLGWKRQAKGQASHVSAAGDNTVLVLSPAREAFMLKNGSWEQFSGKRLFSRIACIDKNNAWGTYRKDDVTYEIWNYSDGMWSRAKSETDDDALGFYKVLANAQGDVLALDAQDNVYSKRVQEKKIEEKEEPEEESEEKEEQEV